MGENSSHHHPLQAAAVNSSSSLTHGESSHSNASVEEHLAKLQQRKGTHQRRKPRRLTSTGSHSPLRRQNSRDGTTTSSHGSLPRASSSAARSPRSPPRKTLSSGSSSRRPSTFNNLRKDREKEEEEIQLQKKKEEAAPPPSRRVLLQNKMKEKLNDRRRMLLKASGRALSIPENKVAVEEGEEKPEGDDKKDSLDGWSSHRGGMSREKSSRLLQAFSKRNLFAGLDDDDEDDTTEDTSEEEEGEEDEGEEDNLAIGSVQHTEEPCSTTTSGEQHQQVDKKTLSTPPAPTLLPKRPPNKDSKASFVRYCKAHGAPEEIAAYNNLYHYHYGPPDDEGYGALSMFQKLQHGARQYNTNQQQQQPNLNCHHSQLELNYLEQYLYADQTNATHSFEAQRHPFWPLVETMSFQRRDLLEVALDDTVFRSLQNGLRKQRVVTHNYLRENLHFYIQLHKQQKAQQELQQQQG